MNWLYLGFVALCIVTLIVEIGVYKKENKKCKHVWVRRVGNLFGQEYFIYWECSVCGERCSREKLTL
jgi:hypothetical protein